MKYKKDDLVCYTAGVVDFIFKVESIIPKRSSFVYTNGIFRVRGRPTIDQCDEEPLTGWCGLKDTGSLFVSRDKELPLSLIVRHADLQEFELYINLLGSYDVPLPCAVSVRPKLGQVRDSKI